MQSKKIKLLESGTPFFEALEEALQKAKESIYIQVYILADDETGKQIVALLEKAVAKGVQVFVLVDAFGSKELSKGYIQDIEKKDIYFRKFSPFIFWKLKIGRRLHQKLIVIDDKIALIGGINIANKYAGYKTAAWLDYAVCIENELAKYALLIAKQLWGKKRKISTELNFSNKTNKILQQDIWRGKREIAKAYEKAIKEAKKEIIIVASYFLPNRNFMKLLQKTAERGVKIRLIFSHQSDVPVFQRATTFLYQDLCKYGIKIYEYIPSVVHAKVMLVDKKWATVGSYNLNALSYWGSVELNFATNDNDLIEELYNHLQKIIHSDSLEIDHTFLKSQHLFISTLNYYLVRFILRFFTWLFRKAKNHRKNEE
ncbi:MAG: phospholipase D-like domain-containing protein [Thermonemataceae bacterium]|nr:phospholipase D-like domain-containing protein [Thermonemataceae bacterium]